MVKMKLTSTFVALFLSLSVSAMPVASAEANASLNVEHVEARSVKCRFKGYGWKKVKCFYQGADFEQ
jgi:hypothetical protein